jgi:hypothetical protein
MICFGYIAVDIIRGNEAEGQSCMKVVWHFCVLRGPDDGA